MNQILRPSSYARKEAPLTEKYLIQEKKTFLYPQATSVAVVAVVVVVDVAGVAIVSLGQLQVLKSTKYFVISELLPLIILL